MRYCVAIYEIDRAYGGPEEGGWWYTTGELQERCKVREYPNLAAAEAAAWHMNDWLQRMRSEAARDPGSMLYSGGWFEARVFDGPPPARFPQQRPYYC